MTAQFDRLNKSIVDPGASPPKLLLQIRSNFSELGERGLEVLYDVGGDGLGQVLGLGASLLTAS